jgi:hypothetical protein
VDKGSGSASRTPVEFKNCRVEGTSLEREQDLALELRVDRSSNPGLTVGADLNDVRDIEYPILVLG